MNRISSHTRPEPDNQLPIEAMLASVEDQADTIPSISEAPVVAANPKAVSYYHALGEMDARQPGVDQHTGPYRPIQPSARLVMTAARAPLTALGGRFAMLQAAYADGTLGQVTAAPIRLRHIVARMVGLLAVLGLLAIAAIITEVVYGQSATALLTGAQDEIALTAAIALSLAVNGAAIVAGGWLHRTHPSIVRRHGVKVASVTSVIVAGVALTLGLVIGGFDNLTIDTITGGGATTVTDQTTMSRPLLTATYTMVLLLVATAMAAGHLLMMDGIESTRIELTARARAEAETASLSLNAVNELLRALAFAYLSAIPEAHRQGRLRVETFNAAFRRAATPEIAELFENVTYDDAEPAWTQDVRTMLQDLDHPNHAATVTRIA